VRSLEREISNICRKVARRVVKEGKQYSIAVTPENVGDFLGVIKFPRSLGPRRKMKSA